MSEVVINVIDYFGGYLFKGIGFIVGGRPFFLFERL